MQFDERDTPATTPTACPSPSPATTTGTAWTPASPAPRRRAWSQGSPGGARASTQQPPGSQRPAEDTRNQGRASRQRTQGKASTQQRRRGCKASRSASPTQPREPGTPAPMQSQRPAKHQSQPHRLHPGSRRSGEGERGRGEKREGAHRKSQHKSAAHHLHPMRPPPRRSTHAASRPSIPGQTASPGERPAPGNSIPLLWSMRNYP